MARSPEVTVTLTDHGRALLAEGAGTFWFILVGAGSIVADALSGGKIGIVGIALAHGLALSVAISSFGAISGGHFNPAVTFGLWVAKKHPRDRLLTYWAAQLVGAIAAGVFLLIAFAQAPAAADATRLGTTMLGPGVTPFTGILVELVLTVFLLWAAFGTAGSASAPRVAGFGIGLAFAAGILVGGPLTGAAMNPARWLGPAVVAGFVGEWIVYVLGPLAGGGLAGLTYRFLFASDLERRQTVVPAPTLVPPDTDKTERM